MVGVGRGRARLALACGAVVLVALGTALALHRRGGSLQVAQSPVPGSAVVVDDLFVHLHGRWDGRLVVHSADPAATLQALTAASPRLAYVGSDGTELSPAQTNEQSGALADRLIARAVGPPALVDDGARITIDTQGTITRAAAETFLLIVSEELGKRGVRSARVTGPVE